MRVKVEEIMNGLSVSRDVKFLSRRYQKIVSVPKDDSHLQSVHLDFAPANPDSKWLDEVFNEYFKGVEETGALHVSALHFPLGGSISLLESDFFSGAEHVMKYLKNYDRDQFFRKQSNEI